MGDVRLSKTLSYILRHGAAKLNLHILQGGFIYVDDLLRQPQLSRYTINDITRVVDTNDKKRYFMEPDSETGRLKIRANQGHTMQVADLELTCITNAADFPVVVHGTYIKNWQSIKKQGLSKMKRNHIHFACGEPDDTKVTSGMRKSCDLLIYIDLKKALADNLEFFISANNVILSSGNRDGVIEPKYFKRVMQRDRQTGKMTALEI